MLNNRFFYRLIFTFQTQFICVLFVFILLFYSDNIFGQKRNYNELVYNGKINDYEQLFTQKQKSSLDSIIENYELYTTNRIIIVTIDSINSFKDSDLFAKNLIDMWSSKKLNDFCVVVVSKSGRRIQTAFNYLIQNPINDSMISFIINNKIVPHLKAGNYYEGLLNGIQNIIEFWPSDNNCYSIDKIVRHTLIAIEDRDVNIYLTMWNKKKFLESIGEEKGDWPSRVESLNEVHKKKFNSLLKQMKAHLFTDSYKIEFMDYELAQPVVINEEVMQGVEITFVVNGLTRKVKAPLSYFKGCYYYFEPINDMLIIE